jgi:hypothetical protein
MGEDFLCGYQPAGGPVIEPAPDAGHTLPWTSEAENRLRRVPAFLRRMVRQRAEAYARELGGEAVEAAHLQELAQRRFGDAGPPAAMVGDGRPDREGAGR